MSLSSGNLRGAADWRVQRAGVRLSHLSGVIVDSSTKVVESIHAQGYRNQEKTQFHQRQSVGTVSRLEKMAQHQPQYAYTVIYVPDVAQAVEFYEKAFGVKTQSLDHSHRWGELNTGSTTIAFTPVDQRETRLTGGVQSVDASQPRHNVELAFSYSDVDAAFKHAVEAGAVPVAAPEVKEWKQKVGYVRDINGVMIRMGSFVPLES